MRNLNLTTKDKWIIAINVSLRLFICVVVLYIVYSAWLAFLAMFALYLGYLAAKTKLGQSHAVN